MDLTSDWPFWSFWSFWDSEEATCACHFPNPWPTRIWGSRTMRRNKSEILIVKGILKGSGSLPVTLTEPDYFPGSTFCSVLKFLSQQFTSRENFRELHQEFVWSSCEKAVTKSDRLEFKSSHENDRFRRKFQSNNCNFSHFDL